MTLIPADARLVLATHNPHKVSELRAILKPLIPNFQAQMVIGAKGLGIAEPVEDGVSFTENALIKATAVYQATGLPALADDSGLAVDIMGGAPGIFSARWAGKHGDDKANLELLLNQLKEVPLKHRQARFICAAALVGPSNLERTSLGEMPGHLLFESRGENGFGYDPIFVPEGSQLTNAELSPEEKNQISHRHQAIKALLPVIATVVELDRNYQTTQA